MRQLLIFLMMLALASACNMRPSEEGESGELGRGVFYYQCVNYTYDSACYASTTTPDFPLALAVGAKFDMEFARDLNDGYDWLRVVPGSPNHVTEGGGMLTVQMDSFAALFSVVGPNEVVDVVHVLGMPIADVALVEGTWDGGDIEFQALDEITMDFGEILQLRGVAEDEYGRALAGLIDYQWTVEDISIAVLGSNTTDSVIQLEGMGEGITKLTVQAGDIIRHYTVEVGEGDPDGGVDTDTDPDADAGREVIQ
jgi:hypothetical protein